MKKIIIILLTISIGANIFLGYKYLKKDNNKDNETYIIDGNNIKINKKELYEELLNNYSNNYIDVLTNKILYEALSEEEKKNADEATKEQIEEIKAVYGNELENVIKQYTGLTYEEYILYTKTTNAYNNKITCEKDSCNKEIYEEMLKALKESNISFQEETLKKEWDNKVKYYEDLIENEKAKEDQNDNSKYLKNITNEYYNNIKEKKEYILVITRTDCSHCESYKPKLAKVLAENNIYAYYVDLDRAEKDVRNSIDELYEIEGTPTTLYINEGKVQDVLVGNQSIDNIKEFLKNNKLI